MTLNHRNAFFLGMAMTFHGWPRGFIEAQIRLWDADVRDTVATPFETRRMILDWQNAVMPSQLACETPQWMRMAEEAATAVL